MKGLFNIFDNPLQTYRSLGRGGKERFLSRVAQSESAIKAPIFPFAYRGSSNMRKKPGKEAHLSSAMLSNSLAVVAGQSSSPNSANSRLGVESLKSFLGKKSRFMGNFGSLAGTDITKFAKSGPQSASILSKKLGAPAGGTAILPISHSAAQRKFAAKGRKRKNTGEDVMSIMSAENQAGRPTRRKPNLMSATKIPEATFNIRGRIRSHVAFREEDLI